MHTRACCIRKILRISVAKSSGRVFANVERITTYDTRRYRALKAAPTLLTALCVRAVTSCMAAAPKSSTTSRHVGKSSDLPWRRSSGCVATAELVLHMDHPSSVRLSAQLRCGSRLPCVLNTLGVAVLPIASDDGASKIICIWSRADDAAEGPHESYPGGTALPINRSANVGTVRSSWFCVSCRAVSGAP